MQSRRDLLAQQALERAQLQRQMAEICLAENAVSTPRSMAEVTTSDNDLSFRSDIDWGVPNEENVDPTEADVEEALKRGVAWCDLASLQPVARTCKYNKSSWSRALRAAQEECSAPVHGGDLDASAERSEILDCNYANRFDY